MLISIQLENRNIQICFKCQEKAIIAHKFKNTCEKLSENYDPLITYDIVKLDYEEAITSDNEQPNEIISKDSNENFDSLITYTDDDIVKLDFEEAITSDSEQPNEITSKDSNDQKEETHEEIVEEYIYEEEVITNDIYEIADERFECSICGNSFKNRENLSRHKVRHNLSAKLKCLYCPRDFYFQRELNFHLKQHAAEPRRSQYRCEICSRNYRSSCSLKKHMQLHSNMKPYRCTFDGCKKSFARKFYLQNHLLTHGEYKPFKCTICETRFNQKQNQLRHMKSYHNEDFYKCDYCNEKSFEKMLELKAHYLECDEFLNSRQ